MDLPTSALKMWDQLDAASDKRTRNMPLVDNPIFAGLFILCYLVFVLWLGPRLMKHQQAFKLRGVLIGYNLFLSVLSLYLCIEQALAMVAADYSFPCMPFNKEDGPPQIRVANAFWLYLVSKVIELLDTVFMVLKKKNDQITFLHVYHHCTALMVCWAYVKWAPAAQSIYGMYPNCVIHAIMYFYYGVAALGPQFQKYLWWKKYLTQMQLIQFCFIMGHVTYSWSTGCYQPAWVYGVLLSYVFSVFLLFLNFYLQAYIKRKRLPKGTDEKGRVSSTNGVNKMSNSRNKAD